MEETNNVKLKKLLSNNGGYISRKQVDANGIPSWFLTELVRREGLEKFAPGFYAKKDWLPDDFLMFQYQYPKFIFSHESALFLLGLTDALPQNIEVTGPANYRPFNPKRKLAIIHTDYKAGAYGLGAERVRTNLGNTVLSYNAERTICDIIRHSERMDSEVYAKALHLYAAKRERSLGRLFEYAKALGGWKKVHDTMLVVLNDS